MLQLNFCKMAYRADNHGWWPRYRHWRSDSGCRVIRHRAVRMTVRKMPTDGRIALKNKLFVSVLGFLALTDAVVTRPPTLWRRRVNGDAFNTVASRW